MKDKLFEICMNHVLSPDIAVVIREPYLPCVPESWNGLLVLAEAQNLSKTNKEYVRKLRNMTARERIFRLGQNGDIGIYPWDDGSLKLAIEAAFTVRAENTAVSNAVLWSQTNEHGSNANPSMALIEQSAKLWAELLPIFEPSHIVTCGKIAQQVVDHIPKSVWSGKRTILRLPSRTAMSRISSMFNETDLLSRYHEVNSVIQRNPEWTAGSYRQNKIFFACHAVSLATNERNATIENAV